ncbi:hypothetical protein BH23ACT2_BH23ACT2_11910 [soil metagenome]
MADEQDQAETLDEDKIGEFPPEKPPGAQAYGATGTDPLVGESVAQEKAVVTPAEEAALHVVDGDAPGFDSTVDEPALADAHELDPEVDR